MSSYIRRKDAEFVLESWKIGTFILDPIPNADVRKNIKAKKVIGGGELDGATCWFECSHCHGAVDIGDVFCKHCGARFVP